MCGPLQSVAKFFLHLQKPAETFRNLQKLAETCRNLQKPAETCRNLQSYELTALLQLRYVLQDNFKVLLIVWYTERHPPGEHAYMPANSRNRWLTHPPSLPQLCAEITVWCHTRKRTVCRDSTRQLPPTPPNRSLKFELELLSEVDCISLVLQRSHFFSYIWPMVATKSPECESSCTLLLCVGL